MIAEVPRGRNSGTASCANLCYTVGEVAVLAQLVEHRIRNAKVAGSIPADGSRLREENKVVREIATQTFKSVVADRGYFALFVAVVLSGLIFTIFTLTSIESREQTVYTQYSGFGEAHFYKNPWTYLYSFTLFGLLVTAINAGLMLKFYRYSQRSLGVAFGWMTIGVMAIAFVTAVSVFNIAY